MFPRRPSKHSLSTGLTSLSSYRYCSLRLMYCLRSSGVSLSLLMVQSWS